MSTTIVEPVRRTDSYPLSPLQHGMLFQTLLAPGSGINVEQVVCRMREPVDPGALERAWSRAVQRHDVLRTRFRWADVQDPLQVVVPEVRLAIAQHDCAGLPPSGQEARLHRYLAEDRARGFDLAQAPAMRLALFRMAGGYVLVWSFHHILLDGKSVAHVLEEVFAAYDGAGEETETPERRPFRDHVAWLRERDAAADEAYWSGLLGGLPAPAAMPAGRSAPRDAAAEPAAGERELRLSAGVTGALRAFEREQGVWLNTLVQGAWALLLGRYTGSDEAVFGVVRGGRGAAAEGADAMVGLLINTVPFRVPLPACTPVIEWLDEIGERTAALLSHEHAALADIRRWAGFPPGVELFDTVVNFQPQPFDAALRALGGKWGGRELRILRHPGFPLTVEVAAEERLRVRIHYDADRFDAAWVDRLLGHFARLLEEMVADPGRPLSRLPLIGPAEREALLAAGRAVRSFPVAESIGRRFERRAAERPDASAVTFAGATLSYGELNARANRVAHRLRALGVGAGTRVGIAMERSAELVVAVLAVLKAGGAYVPVDPAYPAERTAFVFGDAGAAVLVTTSDLLPRLAGFGGAVLCVDAEAGAIARESGENPAAGPGPESLAYVIYTSGSTGKPKGVQVTHANVVRLFDATEEWFGFGAGDVWTLFHSPAFDFSVWEIWGALLYGGRLVVVPFLTTRSPGDFHRLLVDEGVTVLNQTPSAFRQLVAADLALGADPSALRLRHVVLGGEALDPRALRPWMDRHGDERPRLVNMYGITETTVHVTHRVVTRADLERAWSPIGVPIPDLSLYLLDRNLEPVPPGAPGELFVGGAGVARGYLNRPELTDERFIRDPFQAGAGGRLYRTGDRARRLADGELEYLGRNDQQVKVRGFRIEPGEIEAALAAHPGVAHAAVIARGDAGGQQLVAYVAAPPGAPAPGAAELRAHVAAILPEHMVPAAFVALDALPLTGNGKLDRDALPAPDAGAAARAPYAEPRSHAEAALAEAWAEVLGVDRVGIDDNYFALGGDSIRSVRLVAAAGRRGLLLSIPQIFRHQTLRELAAAGVCAGAAPAPRAEPFGLLDPEARRGLPDDVEDAYPASPVQLAMLFHTERDPASLLYQNLNAYRVHTRFDEAAMREALRVVAARHPVLRTSFDLAATPEPLQRVHRGVEIPLAVADLRHLDPAGQDAWMDREKGRGFDWTVPPLLRFHVHLLRDDAFRLILAEHHALLDGWSVASLVTELVRVFTALRDGVAPPVGPPPAARFRDFVALEREAVGSDASREFWRRMVDDAPPATLPPREGEEGEPAPDEAPCLWVDLPAETQAGLRRVASDAGVPLKTVLLAAHVRVLALMAGRGDVVTGYVTSGRPELEDGDRVLGVFLNTVPLRVRMEGETWRELVRRAWAAEESVLPHRRFPLAEIVREAGGRTPFEAAFNFSHFHVYDALAGGGVRLEADGFFQKTEVPLFAGASVGFADGALRLQLDYDPARLSAARARAIARWYSRALAALAARPDARWDEADLLDEPELRLVLGEWNRTDTDDPAASPVHRLFEAQVERAPDAVSVVCEGRALTRAELNLRANRLAHRLIALGVGPEARVGICMERSPELVVSILAVLKAGGGYVPLNPAHPAERLETMLADAAVAVLLTQETLRASLPSRAGLEVLSVDGEWARAAGERAENPESRADPRNLAYVIYTSGSTGTPKGVAIEHAALANEMRWSLGDLALDEADRVLQVAPATFDASVWELLAPLLAGGRLVLARHDGERDPQYLAQTLRSQEITVLPLVPSLLRALLEEPEFGRCTSLRYVVCGGEALPGELCRRLSELLPQARLVNLYGPSECCVDACVHRCAEDDVHAAVVPIGRPVPNTRSFVLDAGLRPVPVGVPGELCIGGAQVGRGYVGRPGLTAERFVPDPFCTSPGARLYRSGDRVRWRSGGTLEFLGREDAQVKVRGFRVEAGEVEAALRRHPDVRECAVVAREDAAGGRRLVAYVEGEADGAVLRAHLRRSLPEYMIPGAFVVLGRLPLTPSGKLDRKALPDPGDVPATRRHVPPRTPAEEGVAAIWAEVLGRGPVGVDDDFFELGGHSLLAARVVSRVRARFGVGLTVRALFEAPTVEALARAVDAERAGASDPEGAIPCVRRDRPLPLSAAQTRLWVLDRLHPGLPLYNVTAARRLSGPLDTDALAAALSGVVLRHEPLRTVFRAVDGEPEQRVLPAAPVPLPLEDLSALPGAGREAAAAERLRRWAGTPFDLERGPLFRAALLRLGPEEHVLFLAMHHIVSDGWSMGILFGELSALYAARRGGGEAALPGLPVQYADYSAWQREKLSGGPLEEQVAWWRARLAGAPTRLELPTDRPRPAAQSYRGALHRFTLPAALADALEALARREGATLYMVLLAAFQLLLARYARQEEVVVGSPVANRSRPEVEGLVGFFTNTLALRTILSGGPTFRGLVARVRETTLDAYAHQEVPFEKLVEELHPERSLGHNPLFQAFFALQNTSAGELRLPGITVRPVETGGGTAKFDLSLFLARGDDGLEGMIEYATDLFDAATIERTAGHLRVLLDGAVAHPGRPALALPVVGPAERETIVRQWSGAGEHCPAGGALHQRFEAQAAARPDAVAVTCEGVSLTYAALNARANRLARRLRALGVVTESRVGLVAGRSLDLVTGILAILKAGGAYVALDPAYPAERLAYMAADAGIRVLLAQSSLRDRVPAGDLEVVPLEDVPADEIADDPGVAVDPSNLAYVVYTSGSTGRPKGVGVTHGNVLRLFDCTAKSFGFGPGDVWTLFHSCAFDFSVWETWGALLYGGRVVVVPFDVSRDPVAFRALLARERVTSLSQTPSAFRALARVDEDAAEPLRHLRLVVFGGEALQYESLRGWLDRYGPKRPRLTNMYGITETTVHVTWHTVTGAELRDPAAGSRVGVPIPDLRAYVLDPSGDPTPIGVPGELHVGGAGLARGYLGRSSLTAGRFVPDPFSGRAGARLYRSGDLARWRADGTLEYLGRIDQQVKIRGFRIEPGEVEAVLLAQPGVAQAAVVVRGEGDDAALVGYFVPSGIAPAHSTLRDALKQHLPEHMVPAAFVALDRIPLTANGKLDGGALPEPQAAGAEAGEAFVAPRTPVEEVLAGIWCEVLGAERVGALDNFFDLGGHSLLAMRVISRARQAFGTELPQRFLFESPTVAELAGRVEALRSAGAPVAPPIEPAPRTDPPPLSFAQQQLWLLDRIDPGSAAYNMSFALRLRGALDVPALRDSLDALVRRHETLRTTFGFQDGNPGPVQVIHPPAPVPLPVVELGQASAAAREREAERQAAAEALRPFDLASGPLLRTLLLRLADDDHVLCIGLHHIASDAWSMQVLVREVSTLYAAFARGEAPCLPELPVQYADFAVWQRAWLRDESLEAHLSYWRDRLSAAPPLLELPVDRPRAVGQSPRAAAHAFVLGPELSRKLRELSRREGATLFMTLLAGWQALLGRYAGQHDVVVGTPVADRGRREVEGLIGFFVNMLPLRTELAAELTWRELLARVREGALGAYDHQELPFERLVEELGVARSLTHTPLFQSTFALHREGRWHEGLRLGEVAVEPFGGGERVAKFDLDLVVTEDGETLDAVLVYRAALFDAATMARLAGHLESVLEAMASGPERRLAELSLLRGAERSQVLEAWNATVRPYPAGVCLHQLFAAQASRTPDAPALFWGDERVTYAELERRSGRMAAALRGRGVGPETRVGVCMHRTPELVVALLGVLRAGGAYVPMDPAYPRERLRYMLADSGAALLLADAAAAERLGECGVEVVRPDAAGAAGTPEEPHAPVHPENLAYVVYTSGSTGTPKGVLGTHRAILNRFAWGWSEYPFAPGEVCCQKSSLAFVDSVVEVFAPLLAGVPSVLAPDEDARDPEALAAILSRHGVTRIVLVPSLLRALLDRYPRLGERCPRLRVVVSGGETLPPELARRFAKAVPGAVLLNVYGMSEAASESTHHPLRSAGDAPGERVSVGRPIWNTRMYVVGAGMEPVPVGAPGELYLAGDGLARGYIGRPAATAERFVPDPFASTPGERLYRTGDRARWTANGELEYLGRSDHQVKVRGIRIELGEIEAAMRAHPAVRDAVAVVRDRAPGDQRLVAYVVAGEGEGLSPAELRAHLGAQLPEYMVPGAIVTLERMPLTGSGKADRRALPPPQWDAELAYVAPRTATEDLLAGIWAEVLRHERVGVHDDFFELGGHSLLATRVVSRIREVLAVEVPLRAIFQGPTVAELAGRVDALRRAGLPALPPVVPAGRTGPYPLSFSQERLWLLDRLQPGNALYNLPCALRLDGALDRAALQRALGEVVRRHGALRTVFGEQEGEAVQVVVPFDGFPLPVEDLTGLDEAERAAETRCRCAAEAALPFDLSTGPLLRAKLLRLGREEHVLMLTLHHIVTDGWSTVIFFRELSALYGAYREGRESPLPELPVQYGDYAVWQRGHLQGSALEGQLAYWRTHLSGIQALPELPTDHPRPAVQTFQGAYLPVRLSAELTGRLEALARREGLTLFMVLLGSFQVLLSRYSGSDDVVVGSPAAGRTRREVEGLIGFFVNTLVLRAHFGGDPTVLEALRRVREATLGAFEHQEVPFARLVAELRPERTLSPAPLFQASFALQNNERYHFGLEGLSVRWADVVIQTSKFDLCLDLAETSHGLEGRLIYSTELFERPTIVRMLGHLEQLLAQVAGSADVRLSELALADEAERGQAV
ncbi:non-ribosomal peptide synthetase [Longimicrobium sp.]|uniref:non-ribosomal peptide synthetase n=1 Tax=Longimicrobium sp. TaxID=2029185 RepID=UPI002CDDB888|nr:non-ribosomal peptide synthetase [Longimicrobium sp.]HSU16596.1 amino acid adenylation domain-containing protein [Longimicrobium sp.]